MLIIGSDPEVFLKRKDTKELVSALECIPGSKHHPFPTKYGSIQPDNILAEFNSEPAHSKQEFIVNHRLILGDLKDVLDPLDLEWDFIASALAPEHLLWDPRAMQAGCDPDFCVWNCSMVNNKPKLVANMKANYSATQMRAAGGHLHISFDQAEDDLSMEQRFNFVKALDYNLGVASVLIDPDKDRRSLYGKAGSFRPKFKANGDPYDGVEYRTLSNFWLKSDDLMGWVYDQVEEVYQNLEDYAYRAAKYGKSIQRIINNSLVDEAKIFCEVESIHVPVSA